MKKSRYMFKARRARQFLTLLFQRTWTGSHLSEYKADNEMWKLFRAQKGVARYWLLRLRRQGLVDRVDNRWRLNRRGSMEFWKALVQEAAETLTDPEKNAAPASEELLRRHSLIMEVGRGYRISSKAELHHNLSASLKGYRKEFGGKDGDILQRVYDMALGQIEREEENWKRILSFPILPF